MMPKTSPASMSRLTASTAMTGAPPVSGAGYALVTSVRLTRAMDCSFRHAETGGVAGSGTHRPLASRSIR